MAESFCVAVMDIQDDRSALKGLVPLEWQYGIQVFDLCVDQICTLMERPDMNIATELGAVPSMQYSVMGGGRLYPVVSREEIARAMQGVDILIIMMSTQPPWLMSQASGEFFKYLFTKNLAKNCRRVVVRITNSEEGEAGGLPWHHQSHSQGELNPETVMTLHYGFDKKKITKAKLSVIADESKKSKEDQSGEDPVKSKISKLRSELTGEEIKQTVTQPVKETVSAGKSLLGLGQRFGSWLGSLTESQ